jgi:hypothetical protein
MPGYYGGIMFLAFLAVILRVIRWCTENDRSTGEPSDELFAMRASSNKKARELIQRPRNLRVDRTQPQI